MMSVICCPLDSIERDWLKGNGRREAANVRRELAVVGTVPSVFETALLIFCPPTVVKDPVLRDKMLHLRERGPRSREKAVLEERGDLLLRRPLVRCHYGAQGFDMRTFGNAFVVALHLREECIVIRIRKSSAARWEGCASPRRGRSTPGSSPCC